MAINKIVCTIKPVNDGVDINKAVLVVYNVIEGGI